MIPYKSLYALPPLVAALAMAVYVLGTLFLVFSAMWLYSEAYDGFCRFYQAVIKSAQRMRIPEWRRLSRYEQKLIRRMK